MWVGWLGVFSTPDAVAAYESSCRESSPGIVWGIMMSPVSVIKVLDFAPQVYMAVRVV